MTDNIEHFPHYTRQLVYGGLDGIITTFSIIAASVGANLDYKIVITMGFANLFADAISMGFGEYISSNLENNLVTKAFDEETILINTNLQTSKSELINLLTEKNFDIEDAESIVNLYTYKTEYISLYTEYLMFIKYGMLLPEQTSQLMKNGVVTFLSFILFGSIPLIVFISMCLSNQNLYNLAFWISTLVAAITMFLLGFIQALLASENPFYNGLLVMFNGILATSCAYIIGFIFENHL